jgi:hypothetical protein
MARIVNKQESRQGPDTSRDNKPWPAVKGRGGRQREMFVPCSSLLV